MDGSASTAPATEGRAAPRPGARGTGSLRLSLLAHGALVTFLFLLPGIVLPGPLRESPPVAIAHPEAPPSLAAPPSGPDPAVVLSAPPDVPPAREEPPAEAAPFPATFGPHVALPGIPSAERLPPSRTPLRKATDEDRTGEDEEGGAEAAPGESDAFVPPEPLDAPEPPYPEWARRRGIEGTVELELTVRVDGTVGPTAVVASSGHEGLDRAAVCAVRTWRFRPATRGGVPVPAPYPQRVVYRLD